MNELTAFGLFAVMAMLVSYALEDRSPWFIIVAACVLGFFTPKQRITI
jgi:hypothetical protein